MGCSSEVEHLPTRDNTLNSDSELQDFFFFLKTVLGKSPRFGASVSWDQGTVTTDRGRCCTLALPPLYKNSLCPPLKGLVWG